MEEYNDVLLEAQLAEDLVDGAVDYRGQPAIRSKSGYWCSAWFIIGTTYLYIHKFISFFFFLSAKDWVQRGRLKQCPIIIY